MLKSVLLYSKCAYFYFYHPDPIGGSRRSPRTLVGPLMLPVSRPLSPLLDPATLTTGHIMLLWNTLQTLKTIWFSSVLYRTAIVCPTGFTLYTIHNLSRHTHLLITTAHSRLNNIRQYFGDKYSDSICTDSCVVS